MANQYLEKIADFDFDAHNAMVATAEKKVAPATLAGGWKGDLSRFSSVSKRSTNMAAKAIPAASRGTGILSRIAKTFK